ncbi:hypothetical protein [Halomontanus rarus]|uniref:hypothetical protein n=1 Tax=Halomontanus rarus TaxID=3034020 RepID=UPI0023E8EA6B|nr:hypothetical protein [Halovivax sp. TS33]
MARAGLQIDRRGDSKTALPITRSLSIPFTECGADYRFTASPVDDPDRTLEAGRRAPEEVVGEFGEAEGGGDSTVESCGELEPRIVIAAVRNAVTGGRRFPSASVRESDDV